MWLAVLLSVLALPLQALGDSGTCTQGANAPFLFGAFITTPMLVVAIIVLCRAKSGGLEGLTAIGSVLLLSRAAIAMNQQVWWETLFLAGSPCGLDYRDYGGDWRDVFVGLAYDPLWVIVGGCSVLALGKSWKSSRSERSYHGHVDW